MPALYWPSTKLFLKKPQYLHQYNFKTNFKFNFFPHFNCLITSCLQIGLPVFTYLLHPFRKLKACWFEQVICSQFFFIIICWPPEKIRENGAAPSLKSDCPPAIAKAKTLFFFFSPAAATNQEAIVLWTSTEWVLSLGELRRIEKSVCKIHWKPNLEDIFNAVWSAVHTCYQNDQVLTRKTKSWLDVHSQFWQRHTRTLLLSCTLSKLVKIYLKGAEPCFQVPPSSSCRCSQMKLQQFGYECQTEHPPDQQSLWAPRAELHHLTTTSRTPVSGFLALALILAGASVRTDPDQLVRAAKSQRPNT